MTWNLFRGLVGWVVCGVVALHAASSEAFQAAAKVCGIAYAAEVTRDLFIRQNPAERAALGQALEAWRERQGIAAIEARLGPQFAQLRRGAVQAAEKSRANLERALINEQKGRWSARDFAELLAGRSFDLQRSMAAEMQLLAAMDPQQGLGPPGGKEAAPGSSVAAPSGVRRYTVRQLTTLYESTREKTPGDGGVKRRAAEAALKQLGTIAVEGVVEPERGVTLTYEDEDFTSSLGVYVDFKDDGSLKPLKGRKATVIGRIKEVDTWIDLGDARFARDGPSIPAADLPEERIGLKRKPIDRSVFLVATGQGVPADNIEGVYVRFVSGFGVGGMMILEPVAYLVLKDGWLYYNPYLAPDVFNAELSRQREPQKWGRWKKDGKAFVIEWKERGVGEEPTSRYTDMAPLTKLPAGAKLEGRLSTIGGGGNTAFGGNTMVVASSDYTFMLDGRFAIGSAAGASGGNDYTGNAPNVAVASKSKDRSGRYTVTPFGLSLEFDSGEKRSVLFAPMNDGPIEAAMIGQSSFTGKGVKVH